MSASRRREFQFPLDSPQRTTNSLMTRHSWRNTH